MNWFEKTPLSGATSPARPRGFFYAYTNLFTLWVLQKTYGRNF
ncbi:hypothetical protein M2273_005550 [Mucilaginibacter lappiensis]